MLIVLILCQIYNIYQTDDSRPVYSFSQKEWEVAHNIDDQGLNDSGLLGKLQEKCCQTSNKDSNCLYKWQMKIFWIIFYYKYVWLGPIICLYFYPPLWDVFVVFFDQCLGAAHYKHWLKSVFSIFFEQKSWKKGRKSKKIEAKFSPKPVFKGWT